MSLQDIVNLAITATTAFPALPNFGEPMIASYHSVFSQRTQEYGSLSALVTAGFATTTGAYQAATSILAQSPQLPLFKIGRRALPYTQTITLTCLSTASTDTYVFQLRTVGGAWSTITVASTGVPATDVATINTAVTALALSGLTATHSGAILTLTMSAGHLLDVMPDIVHQSVADTTADPGIATDLAAIDAADANWYGLVLDSNSPAEILAAAAWGEANGPLMFVTNASDTAVTSSGSTTDVAYVLKSHSYARTLYLHSQTQLLSYSGAAWMGKQFSQTPGSDNWAFKTLAGVAVDALNEGQQQAIIAKNANYYVTIASVNVTYNGRTPSGQFADITRFLDWLKINLQTAIFTLLVQNPKIPYTDGGMDAIRSVMTGVFEQGVRNGGLVARSYVINIPLVAAQSATDRGNRNVNNVTFTAQAQGAVDSIQISGTVTF